MGSTLSRPECNTMKIRPSAVPTLILLIASVVVAQTPTVSTQARRTLMFNVELLEFNADLAREIERAAQDRARLDRLTAEGRVRPMGEIQVRTRSGEPASVRMGQRIPIQTASAQVQYENTGMTLDITPELLPEERVLASMKLDLSTTANGATTTPYFSTRSFVSKLNLKPNERVVLLSVVQQGSLWPVTPGTPARDAAYGNYLLLISVRILD